MPLTQSGKTDIRPATGKLGILLPGMGAVATTFMAGVEAIRRGISKPIGSLTQMGTIRLGKRTDNRTPVDQGLRPAGQARRPGVRRLGPVPRQRLRGRDARPACCRRSTSTPLKEFLSNIKPMTSVFEQAYVKKLTATHAKKGRSKLDLAEQVHRGHQGVQEAEQLRPSGHGLVRLDRGLLAAGARPRDAGGVREGPGRERPGDRALADLRLRGARRWASPSPTARPT